MKYYWVIGVLLLMAPAFAGAQERNDTIWLKPIDISAPAGDSVFMMNVSGRLIPADENLTVENVLSRYTPVFFKTYSPGGIATVSHRGFGASQTLMVWNGFALNQLTLGQPSFGGLLTSVNTNFGLVSGTLAAADFAGGLSSFVYFEDVFYGDSLLTRSLVLSGGSFGTGSASFFSDYRIRKARVSVEISGLNSSNNYIFTNNAVGANNEEWILQNRVSASYYNLSVKSNLLVPLKKGDLKISLWAGSQFNETPASLLSPQLVGNESQETRFVRLSGFLPLISGDRSGLQMRFFLSADTFLYRNNQLALNDGTSSQSFATKWNGYLRAGSNHIFNAEYYPEFYRVMSDNYSKPILHTDQRFKIKYSCNRDALRLNAWIHFISRDFNNMHPLPGFSVGYFPGSNLKIDRNPWEWLKIYAGVARNMRMPTMNDLFWVPGGNPDLKPEDAWMADMTFDFSDDSFSFKLRKWTSVNRFSWNIKVSPFYSHVVDLIRWTPDSVSSQWYASNVAESRQYGCEVFASVDYKWKKNSVSATSGATRVFAVDVSGIENTALIYVPDKSMNAAIGFTHGIWSAGYEFQFTGKRFTDFDNDRYMPEIFLHNVSASVRKKIGNQQFSLSFKWNNIMNADYQYIAWYPMPRRNFYITLKWKWNE